MDLKNTNAHASTRRRLMWGGILASVAALFTANSRASAKTEPKTSAELERLIAIEDIRQLKHRYYSATDRKDFTALRALYTDDAKFTSGEPKPGEPVINGPDGLIQFLSSPERTTRRTKHHGHNALITLTSPTEAEGEWDYEAWTWQMRSDGTLEDQPVRHNWGKYIDRYRKTPDGWRISLMTATLIHKV